MSVAAQVMGWQRRMGNVAGPLNAPAMGSGGASNGLPAMVELLIDGRWTDITSRVMVRDSGGKIDISRGQTSESGQPDPGTCRFLLNNRDGLFSDLNPMSPYYGKIGRNTQIRVSVPRGLSKSYRFWGEVPGWPQSWDITGTDVWCEIQAAGILRRLSAPNSPPLQSAMVRSLVLATTNRPIAYWPCEDLAGSRTIASAISGPTMSILGTPTLATFDGFHASAPLPTMGDALFKGQVPSYTNTGQTQVRFLMAVPAAGATNGQIITTLQTTGSLAQWTVAYGTGGTLRLRAFRGDGTGVYDSGAIAFGVDGELLLVSIELVQDGTDVDIALTTRVVISGEYSFLTTFVVAQTVGNVNSVTMATSRGLTDTALGHVSVQSTVRALILNIPSEMDSYADEPATVRLIRLCAEQGVNFVFFGITNGSQAMGPQLRATFMDLLRECVAADMGILMEREVTFGLAYRPRDSMYNRDPVLALSYPGNNLAQIPKPEPDDQNIRNDVTVTRPFGSSFRVTQSEGPLNVQDAPLGVGPYPDSPTVNVNNDTATAYSAAWRVHIGTVNEPRFPQVSINLAHPSFQADSVLRFAALDVLMGNRLTISGMPSWTGPDDVSQIVLGIKESISYFQHTIDFNGAPESPYRVGTTDDLVYGHVDTDLSTLTDGVGPTDTSALVTTPGYPWTTDPLEFPFDLLMGGEVVTCTAITGVASPQTFTLTRSVNGVVKSQPGGTDVRLAHPAVVAL